MKEQPTDLFDEKTPLLTAWDRPAWQQPEKEGEQKELSLPNDDGKSNTAVAHWGLLSRPLLYLQSLSRHHVRHVQADTGGHTLATPPAVTPAPPITRPPQKNIGLLRLPDSVLRRIDDYIIYPAHFRLTCYDLHRRLPQRIKYIKHLTFCLGPFFMPLLDRSFRNDRLVWCPDCLKLHHFDPGTWCNSPELYRNASAEENRNQQDGHIPECVLKSYFAIEWDVRFPYCLIRLALVRNLEGPTFGIPAENLDMNQFSEARIGPKQTTVKTSHTVHHKWVKDSLLQRSTITLCCQGLFGDDGFLALMQEYLARNPSTCVRTMWSTVLVLWNAKYVPSFMSRRRSESESTTRHLTAPTVMSPGMWV